MLWGDGAFGPARPDRFHRWGLLGLQLTDPQLVILSAATQRQDREALPPPRSLKIKAGVVTKTRWLRLAFLSPILVRQFRAGAHPSNLTIETLTRQVDLPTIWQEQEALVANLDKLR